MSDLRITAVEQGSVVPRRPAEQTTVSEDDACIRVRVALAPAAPRPFSLGRIIDGWRQKSRPPQTHATFTLTGLDLLIYRWCDGRTSVDDLITRLATTEQVQWNESRVIVLTYLTRLTQRGVIDVSPPTSQPTENPQPMPSDSRSSSPNPR